MASASRDKFSRDDQPSLGDIDADVLGEDPVPRASSRPGPGRKSAKSGSSGGSTTSAAVPLEDARPGVIPEPSLSAEPMAVVTSAPPPVKPAHTFGWTRVVFWPLVLAFVALQYRLWVGEGSFAEVWRLKLEIENQEQENHVLGERNRRLSAEVRDLRVGGAAVEERARKQLGMVKDDETLYIIHPKSP